MKYAESRARYQNYQRDRPTFIPSSFSLIQPFYSFPFSLVQTYIRFNLTLLRDCDPICRIGILSLLFIDLDCVDQLCLERMLCRSARCDAWSLIVALSAKAVGLGIACWGNGCDAEEMHVYNSLCFSCSVAK